MNYIVGVFGRFLIALVFKSFLFLGVYQSVWSLYGSAHLTKSISWGISLKLYIVIGLFLFAIHDFFILSKHYTVVGIVLTVVYAGLIFSELTADYVPNGCLLLTSYIFANTVVTVLMLRRVRGNGVGPNIVTKHE